MESVIIKGNGLSVRVDGHDYELPFTVWSIVDFENEIAILTMPPDHKFHMRNSSTHTCNLFVFSKQNNQVLWTFDDVIFIKKNTEEEIQITITDFQLNLNIHTGEELFSYFIK